MKKEKSCGSIILRKRENTLETLILKQINDNWSFPKGHVEENETEEETALREVKEESGLDVSIKTDFRKVITYSPMKGIMKDVVFFFSTLITDEITIQEEEIKDYKWINIYDCLEVFENTHNYNLVEDAISYLTENNYL